MKQIILNKLTLRDFQGGNFTLDTRGRNVDVNGENGSGKTRIVSAATWLLFGRDSLWRTDFEIKNLDGNGSVAHGLEHSVEAEFDIGRIITLKKVFKENWTKKRGSSTATFTGNINQYYFNGVPKTEKEYKDIIAEIAGDEEQFQLITSPTVFANLPDKKGVPGWKRRRTILFDICGDVSDADVIASEPKLALLPSILNGRLLDDHKKVISARQSKINTDLKVIPSRIDENRRSMPDVTGLNASAITASVGKLETDLSAAKLQLQGVDTGAGIASLTKQLAGINADLQKLESDHYSTTMKTATRLSQQITEITDKMAVDRRRIASITGEIESKERHLQSIEKELDALRKKWFDADARVFQDSTEDTCKACGQALPADRVQDAREKALGAFIVQKAEDISAINDKAKPLTSDKERMHGDIDAAKKDREAIEIRLPDTEEELKRLTADLNAVKALALDYAAVPGRNDILRKKADAESSIENAKRGTSVDSEKVQQEISALEASLRDAKEKADRFTRREANEKRITELMAEEKTLAAEFETLESELFLCDLFIRTKVSLLTDRINDKFEIVRFKLFDEQVNGGINECCEITVNGVPYNGGLNNAARINAGLDICRTLARSYEILAPIFIDNAESVSHLIDMDAQVIRLVVSEPDKVLRVEYAHQEVAA